MCGDCRNEEVRVAHAPWRSCFEARVGERFAGLIEYGVRGTWAVLDRAEVRTGTAGGARDDVVRHRLVATALELLRSRGYRILPRCPEATAYLRLHPDVVDGIDEIPTGPDLPRPRVGVAS